MVQEHHKVVYSLKQLLACAYIDFGGGNFVQLETQRDADLAGTDIS